MKGNVLWLVYRKARTSFGLAFGLILMYGAFNGIINIELILVAIGFMLLHLFGDCYNDYWDYEDDMSNKRFDKPLLNNLLTKAQLRAVSFLIMLFGLVALCFTDVYLLLTGLSYSVLLWAYSHPSIRLKKYDISGYALTESPWLLIPLLLNNFFSVSFNTSTWAFVFFFFFQYMYLLCQKDSTDPHDETNLFIRRGWVLASISCIFFASLSSASLLLLSIPSIYLLLVWILNIFVKTFNLGMIYHRKINRNVRGRFVLIEFLTPYLYTVGGLLV